MPNTCKSNEVRSLLRVPSGERVSNAWESALEWGTTVGNDC
jgi:hypothetical protein